MLPYTLAGPRFALAVLAAASLAAGVTAQTPLAGAAPWLDCGLLGVQAWGTVGPVIASPLGAGDVPVLVPPGWPANVVLFAQRLTIDPGTNRVFGSNTFPAIS